jgi:hypothetical protein
MGVKAKYKNGRLKYYNGAVDDETVNETTGASTAISNYGVTRMMSSIAATWKFAAPVLGARKTLVVADTTWVTTIIANAATINNSTDNKIVVTLTTMAKALGLGFELYGASTAQWYMVSGISDIAGSDVTVVISSS